MKDFSHRWKYAFLLGLVLLALLTAGGWFSRSTWLSWYYVRELKRADEQDREIWIERVIGLDQAVSARLIACLNDNEARTCENAGLALERLGRKWGTSDPRTILLASRIASDFSTMSFEGQEAVLRLEAEWLRADEPAAQEILETTLPTLQEGLASSSRDVRGAGYELLNLVVRRNRQDRRTGPFRDMVRRGLDEQDPALRALAVSAAELPELELLDHVVPLLRDHSELVRRAAMLALGAASTIVHDEDLLPWLNDEDPEVRQLCEAALRGRGVPDHSIRLARMITHPQHAVRLEAVMELMLHADLDPTDDTDDRPGRGSPRRELTLHSDLDPTDWYRRLTHDPFPSVQVAALRAARSSHVDANLKDRLREIAGSDPSATVRQLATYYLRQQQ